MKILVTGSSGFIGKAVCKVLESRNHEAISFDQPQDIRMRESVFKAIKESDGVINLAGILGTAEIFGSEYRAIQTNILGAINCLDASLKYDKPLVQIATGHEGQPNPYAITKKCATDLALSRAQFFGQQVVSVKAYHVYGPGQKMCAPHGTSQVRKIIPSFLARALTGMQIEINGSGEQKVDLVYLDDAAEVIVNGLFSKPGSVLEAGTGVPSKVVDVARDVLRAVGAEHSDRRITYIPMRKGEPENTTVIANNPLCRNPWPYKLHETMQWYARELGVKEPMS